MEPKKHSSRDGLSVVDVNDTPEDVYMDSFLEDGDDGFVENIEPDKMSTEDLRIEALKRAIDIAKLMSNVTTQDVIDIATKITDYISNFSSNYPEKYARIMDEALDKFVSRVEGI